VSQGYKQYETPVTVTIIGTACVTLRNDCSPEQIKAAVKQAESGYHQQYIVIRGDETVVIKPHDTKIDV